MFELRWLEKEGVRRLQYRQRIDVNIYAGMGPFPETWRNYQWTEWRDVPVVQE